MQMGDEKRAAYGTKEWTEYVEFRLRNGLSVEEGQFLKDYLILWFYD